MAGSPGPGRGQWGARYAIHASRYLTGKAFRYLKRVIVTPAVYRRFTRLNPGFTYRHWAGVGPGTSPFGLAGTYVFIKQSAPPSHCDPRPLPRGSTLGVRAAGTPSPEVTGPICRFPSAGLPRRALGFSPRGTCVGSRYGRGGSFPAAFSRAPGIGRTAHNGRPFPASAGSPHYGTPRPSPVGRGDSPARPTPRRRPPGFPLPGVPPRYGNINPFPFRPVGVTAGLRADLPSADEHCRGTLAPPAAGILTPLCCYYRRDSRPRRLHRTSRPGFWAAGAPPYRPAGHRPAAPGSRRPASAPSIFGAPDLDG